MRIFVYEYLSTGAMADQPEAASLAREGRAMLDAVLADLADCPGVTVHSMPFLDAESGADEEKIFRRLLAECDAALVIAPEFDEILARRAEWVLEEGKQLLSPTPEAIRLTADKLQLAEHLGRCGVPTVETHAVENAPCPVRFPAVVKPRHGAGAIDTFLIENGVEYKKITQRHKSPCRLAPFSPGGEGVEGRGQVSTIVQPLWGEGRAIAASVALLCGTKEKVALRPAIQRIKIHNNSFQYCGGRLPLSPELQPLAIELAQRAVASVSGLHGYVGVDLLLADPTSGVVVEINPRLTTSYVGLRRLTQQNLMLTMLRLLAGERGEPIDYLPGEVTFAPDGSLLYVTRV